MLLCKKCYEKLLERSGKIMLFCKLKDDEPNLSEMLKLCICQRFCSDKDKYIPHKQRERCKYYE